MRFAPDCALDEEIVTTRPQPAASMSGIADWMQWNVPVRFTASMRSQSSDADVDENVLEVGRNPALVTTQAIGPNAARAASSAGAVNLSSIG